MNALLSAILASNTAEDKKEESERHYVQIDISDDAIKNHIDGEISDEIGTKLNIRFKHDTTYNLTPKYGNDRYINMIIITSNE